MKKIILVCIMILFSGSTAFGLNSYYDNKVGYNNKGGYNNQIPYSAFFNGHSPKPEQKQVQVNIKGKNVQGVVNVNTPEEKVEQEGIED